jgi:hypothetical protein
VVVVVVGGSAFYGQPDVINEWHVAFFADLACER